MLALFLDWIITIGNSSSASTKICQKRHLYPATVRSQAPFPALLPVAAPRPAKERETDRCLFTQANRPGMTKCLSEFELILDLNLFESCENVLVNEKGIYQSVTKATRKKISEFSKQELSRSYGLPHTSRTLCH